MAPVNANPEALVKRIVAFSNAPSHPTAAEALEITRLLELCVSHRLLLKWYLRLLQSTIHGVPEHVGETTIKRAEQLASDGLGTLGDDQLVRLALDPVSLWTLHDIVYETFPDRWFKRFDEANALFEELSNSAVDAPVPSALGRRDIESGQFNPFTSDITEAQLCETAFPWDELDAVSSETLRSILSDSTEAE